MNESLATAMLAEADVRTMVRLVGEVAALSGDHAAKKRFLMDGLCELIGADKWAWALICDFAAVRPPVAVSFLHGGFSEEAFGCFLRACEHPGTQRTNGRMMEDFRVLQAHLTRRQEEIDPEDCYSRMPDLMQLWERADVGAVIMSLRPIAVNSQSCIGVFAASACRHSPRASRASPISS